MNSHSTISNPRGMSDWATAGQSVVIYFMSNLQTSRVEVGTAIFHQHTDYHGITSA